MPAQTKSTSVRKPDDVQIHLLFDDKSERLFDTIADNLRHIDCNMTCNFKIRNGSGSNTCQLCTIDVFKPYLVVCKEILLQETLPQLSDVFLPVECRIEPKCVITSDGTVFLVLDDCSHLSQMDQFFISKCFGQLANFVEDFCSPNFFCRHIAIGKYSGVDQLEFEENVNNVLRRICDHLPSVYADSVEIVGDDSEGRPASFKFGLVG